MFELMLGSKRTCDRVTRRDVIQVGSLGARFVFTDTAGTPGGGLRGEKPVGEVSCILIWLQGGISHIDSFDPKPKAPEEIRGEFGAIATKVPGIRDLRPVAQLAQNQEKYSILRSLNPKNGSHGVADAYMMSGHPFNPSVVYPSYGAVIAKQEGDRNAMPPYVQVGASIDQRFGGGVAGFLGDQYNPFVLPGDASRPGFTVRDVVLPGGVDRVRFQRRMNALQAVDTWQRRMEDDSSPTPLQAAGTFYQKAYNLVTAPHAKKAFDIHSEDPRLRDRFGRNSLGQGCLLARRLIEAGVRFVTVTDGGWDTHQNNFSASRVAFFRAWTRPSLACSATYRPAVSSTRRWSSSSAISGGPRRSTPRPARSLVDGGHRPDGRRRPAAGHRRRTNERPGGTADRSPLLHRGCRGNHLSMPGHPPQHHPSDSGRPADPDQL